MDEAFASLQLALDCDKTNDNLAFTIKSFNVALAKFTKILQETFDAQSRALIMSQIAVHKKRVADLLLTQAITLDEQNKPNKQPIIDKYLEAVDNQLAVLKKEPENSQLKQTIASVLERVEALKSPTPPTPPLSQPPSTNLTMEEIIVLRATSKIGKKTFMPFLNSEMTPHLFHTFGNDPFEDNDGLIPLSESQKEHFFKWARPSEIAQYKQKQLCMINAINEFSIKQECVSDCSFVASLCISAQYEKRKKQRLVTNIIFPQNSQNKPIINVNGKYVVKLWFNGVERRIVIDDRLPVDRHYNPLCSHTKSKTHFECWVPLIEKAYMKLMSGKNGYGFIGSNSGFDLFSLTGWLPERVFFSPTNNAKKIKDHETTSERVWERLQSSHKFGDSLMTAAVSDSISDEQADSVGLFTGHAYAILNIKQAQNRRFVLMKNPWASKPWVGRYSSVDSSAWTSELQKEIGYDFKLAQKSDDGLFWICWEDFLKFFRCLHVNWCPSLFKYKFVTHACWPKSLGPVSDKFFVCDNPQYYLVMSEAALRKKSSVWILINRHSTENDLIGNKTEETSLTAHIHRLTKEEISSRIVYPNPTKIINGIYSNNPLVMIRYDVTAQDKHLAIILSQYKKFEDISYTISVYSTDPFTFKPAPSFLPNNFKLKGQFDPSNSGGAVGRSSSYFRNPQYKLEVKRDTKIEMLMKVGSSLSINISVSEAVGRVNDLSNEVFGSGSYRTAVGYCRGELKMGKTYVVVCSAWNEGDLGAWVMDIFSEGGDNVVVKRMAEEGENYNKYVVSEIVGSTGCANNGRFLDNTRIVVKAVGGTGSVFARLNVLTSSNPDEAINLSFYGCNDEGIPDMKHKLASTNNGVYTSSGSVASSPINIQQNDSVCLILSTFDPSPTVSFELRIFSQPKARIIRL